MASHSRGTADRVRRVINAEVNGRCGTSMRARKNGEQEAMVCLQLVRKIVANVLSSNHPDGFEGQKLADAHIYRSISCASRSFRTKIECVTGGEQLMQEIGFRKVVREFVGYWVLEEREGERERLLEAVASIDASLAAMAASTQRWRKSAAEEAADRREQVLKDIEEDKNERILKLQRLREGKQPDGKEAAESGDDR